MRMPTDKVVGEKRAGSNFLPAFPSPQIVYAFIGVVRQAGKLQQ